VGKGKGKGKKTTSTTSTTPTKSPTKPKTKKSKAKTPTSDSETEELDDTEEEDGGEKQRSGLEETCGKKVSNDWTLPREVEPQALTYLQAHDIMWNKQHPQFNRSDLVDQAWKDFAAAFPPFTG
jgi:hypothetical protein